MPPEVRAPLERSLGASMLAVRVHADARAQGVARSLSARAVTYGKQIFLGPGERPDDLALMAHEAAHVVQQQGGPSTQALGPGPDNGLEREAHAAAAAVQRGEPFTVQGRTGAPRPQRIFGRIASAVGGTIDAARQLGIDKALNYIADKANLINGFRLFTIVLGVNPINMSKVDRSPANLLRALVEVMPGGQLVSQALDNHGVFEKAGTWVEQQIKTLGMIGSAIKQALLDFLAGFSVIDLADLGGVWSRARKIFTDPIDKIFAFAAGLVSGIVELIKDAILVPLGKLAAKTPAYDLLKAVLGKDPVTGEAAPQDANALIGGLMKLAGQQEVWENVRKSGAIGRVVAWFQKARQALVGFVEQIPTLAVNAFKSLQLADIILLPKAFARIAGVFGGFVASFIGWAAGAAWSLLEIVFDVVSPGAFATVKRTGAALRSILKNPLPFVGNLARAARLGFQSFATRFGDHLKAGLIDWLTGSLPGIYVPRAFTLPELIKFVLSVLGLSWQNVRQKLVRAVGETAVKAMETGFDIVVTLVKSGPAAAWDKLKEHLSNLRDQVIGGIVDLVVDAVVKKAVPKVVAMFIPGAGFISAILSIYDLVMTVWSKLSKIAQVAAAFANSVVQIAAGNIGAAAKRVESVMAGLLSLAISFLAGFAGLGRIADKVMGVITRIRAPIDKALDALVSWIVGMARKLGKLLMGAAQSAKDLLFEWWKHKAPFSDKRGRPHKVFFAGQGAGARLKVASAEMFTEELEARVEAVFATDPIARSFGIRALGQARRLRPEIDKLKAQLEREKQAKSPSARFTDQKLKDALGQMAASLQPLIDILPENAAEDLPIKAGDAVTLPYKGAERKADILFASKERVNYEIASARAKLQLPAAEFKKQWAAGTIRPYVEKGAREEYLGATPGKASTTGKAVLARYKTRLDANNEVEVLLPPNRWWPLSDCDMSHDPVDAVDYWNNTARPRGYAPRGPEVRAWMLDAKNYILEPSTENRSRGSRNRQRYLPP